MNKRTKEEQVHGEWAVYNPQRWHLNLVFRNYTIRASDFIPAFAGVIGKISLVAAFAVAWAQGLGITDASFIAENVRLELVIGGVLTLLFSAFLNPYAAPPGTLAPFIPLVSAIALAGIHPLALSLMIGIISLLLASVKGFSHIIRVNGPGTTTGIILLFGLMGIISSLESLKQWTIQVEIPDLLSLLLFIGIIIYILLTRLKAKYLIIPVCALTALGLSALLGAYPELKTVMGAPIFSPSVWWNEKWGLGLGLKFSHFISAFPFALLAVIMCPIDALAIKKIQEANYPEEAKKAIFHMDDTYIVVALRNILGTLLGGAQIASIWRSFMIPLATVKRPIGGSALILGILSVVVAFLGFPIDVAVFPPLLWLVLIVGVYVPLLEVAFSSLKSAAMVQITIICLLIGLAVHPIIAWVTAMAVENFNLLGAHDASQNLSKRQAVNFIFDCNHIRNVSLYL